MKNFNIKKTLFATILTFGALTSCQQEDGDLLIEDKDVSAEEVFQAKVGTDCSSTQSSNWYIKTGTDKNSGISNAIDDRSCTYDFSNSGDYGLYRLNSADNSVSGSLQTRIERTTKKVDYSDGASVRVSGTVKILEAANTGSSASYPPDNMKDTNGTYIAQVKGKHNNGGGSPDPAIMLLIAKPARWNKDGVDGVGALRKNSARKQSMFHIYAEMITKRGGSGDSGRELIYITTVNNGSNFWVGLTSRFGANNSHYIDYNVNGVKSTLTVPTENVNGVTATPKDTKIRMGAYRCKGGKADIRWKDNLSTDAKYTRK